MIPRTQATLVPRSRRAEIDEALARLQRPPTGPGDTKARLIEARAAVRALAQALEDGAQVDRLEGQLYDAWLRLECARALGDGALLEGQWQAWTNLVARSTFAAPTSRAA